MSKANGKGKSKGFQQPWDVFQGYCGGCWQRGHKKAHCPSRSSNSDKMDVGSVQSTTPPWSSASTASSDVGTSVSAKVAAVSLASVPEEDGENWPDDG